MDFEKLACLLFPDIDKTPAYFEEKYPARTLKEGARVTRFAPSPTGYLHIGGLFGALTDIMTAKASGGVSYLRIEDTDKKREIAGGVAGIAQGLAAFNCLFDEGITGEGSEKGEYGPYKQSLRVEIYHTVAKELVKKGLAYPCFCTEAELTDMRSRQEAEGTAIWGYFGKWAKCRELTYEQIEEKIKAGQTWVLRFRSSGRDDGKVFFDDLIRGKIEMPENIIDEVLLKSDGIPTYHFAHVCDDHFMRTTLVLRGEEWISSVPKHIAMFKACEFKQPKYAHTSLVMKIDEEDGTKRKISKRKDPEANVMYFVERGIPATALIDYLLTLLNSNFEDWRRANSTADAFSFPFNLKKMSPSGCLFDLVKLNDISKNMISVMDAETVYKLALTWASKYDEELYSLFTADENYAKSILKIDRDVPKPRKDIASWSELKAYAAYFYDSLFTPSYELPENVSREDAVKIIEAYLGVYSEADEKDEWFAKVKSICEELGYTPSVKDYKKNPELYKGHVGDVSTVIRIAVTGRTNTPDLCEVMKLLGKERSAARMRSFAQALK